MRVEEGFLFCYNVVTLSVLFQRFFEERGGYESKVLTFEYLNYQCCL